MVHALRVAPVLHGAVSPHGFNAADFLLEAERQYEQRLKVLGDAQHLADLARIKGQEKAAAEVPRIRRQLDGLRGDARINGIQFCPRPRLTENGDVTGGTLTRCGAVPIGQHPRPFQRRENGGASFRGFRNGKPQRLRVSTARRHAGTRNKPCLLYTSNAWDKRDLSDIAQFSTPAFQKEIQQPAAEDKTPGNTEIMLVNASLLSVDTVGDEQIAQVYFNVLLREDPSQEAPIDVREIWHFVRPASGDGTWKLDGIQQVENV